MARQSPSAAMVMPHGDDRLPVSGRDRAQTVAMAAWKDVEQAETEFAARVRRLFDGGRHKTIAALRADGSPRISGVECEFADGELKFGSMPGARKGADLRRDPRFALHGPAFDPRRARRPSGQARRRSLGGRSSPGLSAKGLMGICFSPTFPRSSPPG